LQFKNAFNAKKPGARSLTDVNKEFDWLISTTTNPRIALIAMQASHFPLVAAAEGTARNAGSSAGTLDVYSDYK